MTSIVQRLAEIREQQGLPPMPNPGVIDGPPMPPPPLPEDFGEPTVTEPSQFVDEDGEEAWGHMPPNDMTHPAKVSPLIAAAKPKDPEISPKFLSGTPQSPAFLGLCVFDNEAGFQGHSVKLTDRELAACKRIVLGALQREVRAQLKELSRLAPKRARKARTVAPAPVTVATVAQMAVPEGAAPKKRRGRPRGSLLK